MIANKRLILKPLLTAICFSCATGSYGAPVDEATVNILMARIEQLAQRVEQLEAAGQQDVNAQRTDKEIKKALVLTQELDKKIALSERVKIKGDFRLRYENIDDATKITDRDRTRVRARLAITGQVTDDLIFGLGFASGGDDPVSTNQSLGNGSSTKGLNLDMAYFDWSGWQDSHLVGGKFKNPFFKPGKHALLWDGDFRPEGLAYKYDNGKWFTNAAFMFLESDNKAGSQDTESFWGGQIGFQTKLGNSAKLTAGVSYFDIGVAGKQAFFVGDFFGNSVINSGEKDIYQNDFQVIELFGALAFNVGDLPSSVFLDWVRNQDADDNNTGFAVGATFGKAKKPGTWMASYIYQDLESDAVLGLTTNSDFGGGGSNTSGHLIKASYAVKKNTSFALSYFINEKGDLGTDFDRLQLDFKLKY